MYAIHVLPPAQVTPRGRPRGRVRWANGWTPVSTCYGNHMERCEYLTGLAALAAPGSPPSGPGLQGVPEAEGVKETGIDFDRQKSGLKAALEGHNRETGGFERPSRSFTWHGRSLKCIDRSFE